MKAMKSAICTLFEGHYHYGVATLSNSLYRSGFRGTIYVGYRGKLPQWALEGEQENLPHWKEAKTLKVAEDFKLTFIHLETNYSLTNYKPDFMAALWDGPACEADAIYFFDPDIVVTQPWSCFEQWVTCGVAVCEDVNSPIPKWHPRRVGWRSYFKNYQLELTFKSDMYANGGFIGLIKSHSSFLDLWIKTQQYMGDAIGGLGNSIFSNQTYKSTIPVMEGFQIFDKSDQDALNASIEAYSGDVSFIGAEAMGFKHGDSLMLHASGGPKPWMTNPLLKSLQGKAPTNVECVYWAQDIYPIKAHSNLEVTKKRVQIKIGKFVSKFIKR